MRYVAAVRVAAGAGFARRVALRRVQRIDAGLEDQQLSEVAAVQRQLVHHLFVEGRAQFGGCPLHHHSHRIRAHRYRLAVDAPTSQPHILGQGLVHVELEYRQSDFLEATLLHRKRVVAGQKIDDGKRPIRAGVLWLTTLVSWLTTVTLASGTTGAGRVRHGAVHHGRGGLRKQRCTGNQRYNQRSNCGSAQVHFSAPGDMWARHVERHTWRLYR